MGDLAECIALLLDDGARVTHPDETPLSEWVEQRILPLRGLDADAQRTRVTGWWRALDRRELFLLNKLLTGELRVGVSATLVLRALAEVAELPPALLAQRTMGDWTPSAEFLERILAREHLTDDASRPYPFFLASPLEDPPESLGERTAWQAEWKWDGIRGQLIRRAGGVFLWSRGEELITERFPEVVEAGETLPEGTVLDGEVLAYGEDRPLPFALLQTRIGRQKLTSEDTRRGSGRVHGLRPAGARGRGRPRAAAVRAPRAAGGAARRAAPSLLRLRGARGPDLGGARRTARSRHGSARWRG